MKWGAVTLAAYACAIALIYWRAPGDWVVISGALSLGLLPGVLVAFFVQEAETWNHSALGFSVAALATSGVVAILRYTVSDAGEMIWFYPIGLVIGFIIGTAWDWKE